MSQMQYMPGDQRLVDQILYQLKSKGIFDKFRKECISDVDTRPAYQNLRQRVESSVATFLSHQLWKPDLNKNQLREKLRKHILDGNYLEQGVERIVDQVVNPKVSSVFIPQVEELVYNYLGIPRRKTTAVTAETSNGKLHVDTDLLPTDLEAVSPDSVKSNHDDKDEPMDTSTAEYKVDEESKMEVDMDYMKEETRIEDIKSPKSEHEKRETTDTPPESQMSGVSELTSQDSVISIDKSTIPLPAEEIKLENIPAPIDSPPDLDKDKIPNINISMDIPLPDESPPIDDKNDERESCHFKPITSDDDDSSSDSSLRRNVSPLTPIRNYNNENSCDALQGFDNDSKDNKCEDRKDEIAPASTFRFTIESKESSASSGDACKNEKEDATTATTEQTGLSYQFQNQVNLNPYSSPIFDDSSSSNNLHIDYESDVNSKTNNGFKMPETEQATENVEEPKPKENKAEDKKTHKGSRSSKDSHRHSSSSRDRRSDSKSSRSKDRRDSKTDRKTSKEENDRKPSKDENTSSKSYKSNDRGRSRDRNDKKDSRNSSKRRHSSSTKNSSSHKDSKSSHKSSSSSSQRHSSSRRSDDKKSSSDRDRKDKSDSKSLKNRRDSSRHSSSHRSDKDKKCSSSRSKQLDDKEKEKKDKKITDDHYSASGRGNNSRRSTDRDSNDGNSSSSKGSNIQPSSKSSETKKESKSSKSENTSTSSDTTSQSDNLEQIMHESEDHLNTNCEVSQSKPIIRIDGHLGTPISEPANIIYPDVNLRKPKFAANMQEAKKLMKIRKLIEMEQRKMNQDAALLLEFQQNVRPGISQAYSTLSGPELEFVCYTNNENNSTVKQINNNISTVDCTINYIENNTTEISSKLNDDIAKYERNDAVNETEQSEYAVAVIEDIKESYNDIPEKNDKVEVMEIQEKTKGRTEFFEVTIITEEVSEEEVSEQTDDDVIEIPDESDINNVDKDKDTAEADKISVDKDKDTAETDKISVNKDIDTAETDEISVDKDVQQKDTLEIDTINLESINTKPAEIENEMKNELHYFGQEDKYNAEIERDTFFKLLNSYINKYSNNGKLHLINLNTYEEDIFRNITNEFGDFEIVNYHRNGHTGLVKTQKNITAALSTNFNRELRIPVENMDISKWSNGKLKITNTKISTPVTGSSPVSSPTKSDCLFELSNEYDAKLQEMVKKTSRQEIMEIILGANVPDDTSANMPKIDLINESTIDVEENGRKRKISNGETSDSKNRNVLTPNKIRKTSESEQITSTTEDDRNPNNVAQTITRSKYLGRAKRLGLPRPRKVLPKSPSSHNSIENYEEPMKTQEPTVNGKLTTPQRAKIQRYDTSELYKPKLNYLSRRNNIS